jgi:hypothetical protein
VEEVAHSSGLPSQASIAGCQGLEGHQAEWWASLKRLGHERSQVTGLFHLVPSVLEAHLVEELVGAVYQTAWSHEPAAPGSVRCTFLTACTSSVRTCWPWGHAYVLCLEQTGLQGREADGDEEWLVASWEPIVPDTDHSYTMQQMARAWEAVSQPVAEEDARLSVDPDDYPLF